MTTPGKEGSALEESQVKAGVFEQTSCHGSAFEAMLGILYNYKTKLNKQKCNSRAPEVNLNEQTQPRTHLLT